MILSAHCPQSEHPPLRRRAIAIARKPHQLWRASSPALLLVALIGLPEPGIAGTGRQLSSWMTRAPAINGQMSATEWSEATLVDMGAGVTLRIGNDARTLYLSILHAGDFAGGNFTLFFDDEGGPAPVLDDSAWTNTSCQNLPDLGEGGFTFWINGLQAYFYESLQGSVWCPSSLIFDRVRFGTAAGPEGRTYEVAIPLDGPLALRAGPGARFGVEIWVYGDNPSLPLACWPSCSQDPASFRNLILASGGCNTGPQEFGSGDPQIGLPLDWTSEITLGNGPGWSQSLPPFYGDGAFCESNDTGGAGAAACVANALDSLPNTDSLLRMPLPLAGQTSATVRLRAKLVVDPSGAGPYDSLSIDLLRQDGTANHQLVWSGQDESGNVVLPLDLGGSPPVELLFTHSTLYAGGLEGGYAQIDDVELLCGPALFADDFESGLTTHWSATAL